MTQSEVSKAEAAQDRSEETRSFVRRVKAATRRRYAPEEKRRYGSCWRGSVVRSR